MEKNPSKTELEIVQLYERRVKQAIQIRLRKEKYDKLECLEIKLRPQTDPAVVELWTKNPTHQLWADFEDDFKSTSEKWKYVFEIAIVDVSTTYIAQSFPITPYALGRSVNIDGVPKGSGTMGGYLVVTDKAKQEKLIFGLTNNHVVNISKVTQDKNPDPLAVYVGNGIVIPSQDDFAAAKADVVKKGTVSVAVPKSVFSIGSLKYASGRRITTKPPYRILDWALIYSSQKTFQNDRNEFKKDYKVNGAAKTSNVPSELVGKLPVKGIVPLDNRIQPRDIVFKYGRTTGWTKGVIHSEPHKIDLELATEWKGEIDHPKEIKESEEFFVNSKMYAGFAEGGDSGSWILNKEGELAGLLWGKFGEYALITDIHTVLESIREVCDWQNKEIEVLTEL